MAVVIDLAAAAAVTVAVAVDLAAAAAEEDAKLSCFKYKIALITIVVRVFYLQKIVQRTLVENFNRMA